MQILSRFISRTKIDLIFFCSESSAGNIGFFFSATKAKAVLENYDFLEYQDFFTCLFLAKFYFFGSKLWRVYE